RPGGEAELRGDEEDVDESRVRAARAKDVPAVRREPDRPHHERECERRRGERQEMPRAPEAPDAAGRTYAGVERGARRPVHDQPVDSACVVTSASVATTPA